MSKELTIKQRARRAAKTWRERPGPIDTSPKWAMLADIIAAEFAPLAGKNEKLTADNDILGAICRELDADNIMLGIKPILDELVAVGLLRDDSPKCCDLRPIVQVIIKAADQHHLECYIESIG